MTTTDRIAALIARMLDTEEAFHEGRIAACRYEQEIAWAEWKIGRLKEGDDR